MKNKILFLAVVVLSFVAIGSFKKETTFSDNNIKEETPKEDIPVVKLEQSSLDEFFDEFKF